MDGGKSDIRAARRAAIEQVAAAAGTSVEAVQHVLGGYYAHEGPTKRRIVKFAAEAGLIPAPDPVRDKRARPCLCCGTTIPSEGPHHRHCAACRRLDIGDAPVRVAIPRDHKRHPK